MFVIPNSHLCVVTTERFKYSNYYTIYRMEWNKRLLYYLTGGIFLVTLLSGINHCYRQNLAEVVQNRRTTPKVIVQNNGPFEQEYAKAQQNLDDLRKEQHYDEECSMDNPEEIADLIEHIEDEKDIKIENPLKWNKAIKNFTLEATKNSINDAERCWDLYTEILKHMDNDSNINIITTAIGSEEYFEENKKFRFDCVPVSIFYVACLRSIGIESYVINVNKDHHDKNISDYVIKGKKGWGHWSSMAKIDGNKNIIVELSMGHDQHFLGDYEMFNVPYKEIEILNDLDVAAGYYRKIAYEYIDSSKHGEAIKVLEIAEKINPLNESVVRLLSKLYAKDYRFEESIERLRRMDSL